MAMGLIAAALGGAGKALSSIGEIEAKKQNEAKLRKELMDMESTERLRLDEIMFERKMKRLPQEATATAEANVTAEAAAINKGTSLDLPKLKGDYEGRITAGKISGEMAANVPVLRGQQEAADIAGKRLAGVPEQQGSAAAEKTAAELETESNLEVQEKRGRAEAKKDVAKLIAENGLEKAKLLAEQKVMNRKAELAAIKEEELDEEEARAKYNALKTDIRIAKELGVDVAEAERDAEKEKARIDALIKKGVPKAKADFDKVTRLETARANADKELIEAEASLLAKQKAALFDAMKENKVYEKEGAALLAQWESAKLKRDKETAERIENEIKDEIQTTKRLASDPTYLKNKRAIEAATRFTTGGSSKSEDKTETSLDLERKLKASTQKLALALGVDDNKVNEAYKSLSKKALTDPKAKEKLEEIQPLFDAVNTRLTALENYTVKGKPENKSGTNKPAETTYKIGEERILSDGLNKGKTVVWDGKQWNVKK